MADGVQVALGDLVLGAVDEAGVDWRVQANDGLLGWDSAEVRTQITQREADHGAWQGPVYLGERPITIAGTITAPDRAALEDAQERLRAAAGLGDTVLTVYETVPKQAVVRRSGKPLLAYVTDRIATYSVMVTATDPRRYDVNLQTGQTMLPSVSGGVTLPYTLPYTLTGSTASGQVDCANLGNFETRPVITITGPVSQPQVLAQMPDGSVRPLSYSQDLGVGDQLVIDVDGKDAILNGTVSRRRFLSVPLGWPSIPAGATVGFQFAGATYDPAALLTVQWRSAWI